MQVLIKQTINQFDVWKNAKNYLNLPLIDQAQINKSIPVCLSAIRPQILRLSRAFDWNPNQRTNPASIDN